jgi:hypothetical protein
MKSAFIFCVCPVIFNFFSEVSILLARESALSLTSKADPISLIAFGRSENRSALKTYVLTLSERYLSSNSFVLPSVVITTISGFKDTTPSSEGLDMPPIFCFFFASSG